MDKKKLKREIQCAKCPWKVETNPHEIPNGYCETKHKALDKTITKELNIFDSEIHVMACHHSKEGNEDYCVGWLMNQLGPGNNIMLRFKMLNYDLSGIRLIGEQHECFEDTLPENKII